MKKGLIGVLSGITGAGVGAGAAGKLMGKKLARQTELAEKHLALYMLMNQWVQVKQDGKSLVDYFEKYEYKNIVIYGMNFVGQTLCKELESSSINIKYAIDKNAESIFADCDVVTMEDNLEEADAVIVTPIYYFDEIEEELSEKMDCPIISLEDILYEI